MKSVWWNPLFVRPRPTELTGYQLGRPPPPSAGARYIVPVFFDSVVALATIPNQAGLQREPFPKVGNKSLPNLST